jgi:histidine ammonia-lyase
MENVHYISPEKITFGQILVILRENYKLVLSDESKRRIIKCRDYLDAKMENQKEPIYGITTGFGSLCNHTISLSQLSELQSNLIKSHACGVGDEVSHEIVKLMLFLKAHALSMGHSGVQLQTVQRILDFYNNDIFPVVFAQGSLGASGDLAPLSHLFLPLIGEGEVYYKGARQDTKVVLEQFGWKPIDLKSKEGLALLNGTQFMSAHGVSAMLKINKLVNLADIISAISLEGFDGRIDPFYDKIQQIRPHPGQIKTAANIRKILEGSILISQHKKHVQDPYSFRCIPQVHGASKDAIKYASDVILTEINSVTDNPTIFPDDDEILSGGNFHGQPLGLAYDILSIAISELGSISERRVYRLISGWRDLPEFLIVNPGLNSGFMIPQYVAAAIVSQNKQLSTPTTIDSIPSSNEQEDHVSMGGNGATRLIKIVSNVEKILAIELLNAVQALEFRGLDKTSPFLMEFIKKYRKQVPFIKEDVILYHEIEKSIRFLQRIDVELS